MVYNVLLTEVRLIILVKEYLLFVCCSIGAFQGKLPDSAGVGGREDFLPLFLLSPLHRSKQHDLEIGIKKSLGVPRSQPSEKAIALPGFPNSICKANGIVAAKHLLHRKLKEQKGRNFTCVWK